MELEEKVQKAFEKITELRKGNEKLTKAFQSSYKKWEKLSEELNKQHSDDIEWLIRNPDTPGQYEMLRDWVKETYGGGI